MGAILKILSYLGWFIKRWLTKRDDPNAQLDRAKNENSQTIATHNPVSINISLDRLTNRVPERDAKGDRG